MKKEGDEEQKESRMETQGLGVANPPGGDTWSLVVGCYAIEE